MNSSLLSGKGRCCRFTFYFSYSVVSEKPWFLLCEKWYFEIKIYACSLFLGHQCFCVYSAERELCVYACVCFCIYLLCHLLIYVKYPICTNTVNCNVQFSIFLFVIYSPTNQPVRSLAPVILNILSYLLNPAIYTK